MNILYAPEQKISTEYSSLDPGEFQYLCQQIRERSGISIGADKMYLVESRLLPVARDNGMNNLRELVRSLRSGCTGIATQIVNAMATHETFFYRDGKPFEVIRNPLLPDLIQERRKTTRTLRIWSSACSSGQEPYTIAMILKDFEKDIAGWQIDILGTDISAPIIEKAKKGIYTQFEVQRGLPIQLLIKYFTQLEGEWQINPALRTAVKFQTHNLMNDSRHFGVFDIILCRNVLIYFDPPTKATVLSNIAKCIAPDGYLFLGTAETVLGISNLFEPVEGKRGVYKPIRN